MLDIIDLLILEFAAAWRHYHAAFMRTAIIARTAPRIAAMHDAGREGLLAAEEALRPGEPAGTVFDAPSEVMKAHGQEKNALYACGYSLETTFAPNWMD